MVVIRINGSIKAEQARIITEAVHTQAKTGVIVLPGICELLNEVPADEEIQVFYQDERVAELEKELATAMAYISAEKACVTCKHLPIQDRPGCEVSDYTCQECDDQSCECKSCDKNGSNWEWKGTHD